ncbi:MAG: membrane protein insertase YidC [Bauldia litoralis]
MTDQKNLLLAIVFSVAIIFGFQLLFPQDSSKPAPQPVTPATAPGTTAAPGTATTASPGGVPGLDRSQALKESPRIAIDTPRIKGSIALKGGRIDDIVLQDYWKTINDKQHVELLNPADSKSAYFTEFGWYRAGNTATPILSGNEDWTVEGNRTLAPGKPVTLKLTSGALTFERTYAIDKDYMITVTRKVTNTGDQPVQVFPFSRIRLFNTPETLGFFVLHEGPMIVERKDKESRGTQEEKDYSDIRDKPFEVQNSIGGWLGFSGHYWLVALIPDQEARVNGRFQFEQAPGGDKEKGWYTGQYTGAVDTVAPGKSVTVSSRVFAGAKESTLLTRYQEDLKITRFEWAIDWGWFWFFTKPFLFLLKWFYSHVGNFGVAILLLTVCVKIVFFPLANRSYKSMSRMKKLQPELVKLRERFKDDKQRVNQEMMAMYRREKINPAAGCWPILVQIPVFFALYKVLFVSIEMRHAPFFGWIQDLSAQDPTSIVNLFGILPWGAPEAGLLAIANIGLWPIFMGITMWLQQKLNPAPPDPMQQKIFMLLPIVFTIMLASFPAGPVIYWAWNNTLSIAQQWIIMKRQGVYATASSVPTNIRDLKAKKADAATDSGETQAADDDAEPGEEDAPAPKTPPAKKTAARKNTGGRKSGTGAASRKPGTANRKPGTGPRGGKRRR